MLAVALHEEGDKDTAVGLLRQQLKQDPANRAIRLALVSYLQVAGDTGQAAQLLTELAAINPQDPAL
ncbi:hypothetical protein D3C86_1766420 [compost metagenome]